MVSYEGIYILSPSLDGEELEKQIDVLKNEIVKLLGEISETKTLGKRKLAYPVKKMKDGIYLLINFIAKSDIIDPLLKKIRIDSNLLRVLILKKKNIQLTKLGINKNMVSLNKIYVAGNLTRDPEIRYTPSGNAVADFDLAINNYYLTKTGEKKNDTVFVNIIVWGKQAESLKDYIYKGSPILVEGRLQLDSWETKEKEKRSKLRINAQRIQFLKYDKKVTINADEEAGM